METKEIKIQIPEGYEIDKEKSTFEKIIFKKKSKMPKSWEEYCELQVKSDSVGYYFKNDEVTNAFWHHMQNMDCWKDVLPTEQLAGRFVAYMQLMSLRHSWIEIWSKEQGMTGDWTQPSYAKDCFATVVFAIDGLQALSCVGGCALNYIHPLSFPSIPMARDFIECFRDLLIEAKGLY